MKLIFERTKDTLSFTPSKVAEYYIQQLGEHNKFHSNIKKVIPVDRLSDVIVQINDFFQEKLKIDIFSAYIDCDWTQTKLNDCHRDWAKIQQTYPIIALLQKVKPELVESFRAINSLIHDIEYSYEFDYCNYTTDVWSCKNKFDTSITTFDRHQISIQYSNLGRSLFNKWFNSDDNIEDSDTNNFDNLSGDIRISLRRPFSVEPFVEYVNWCKQKNVKIIGAHINIGNFNADLDTLQKIWQNNINGNFYFEI